MNNVATFSFYHIFQMVALTESVQFAFALSKLIYFQFFFGIRLGYRFTYQGYFLKQYFFYLYWGGFPLKASSWKIQARSVVFFLQILVFFIGRTRRKHICCKIIGKSSCSNLNCSKSAVQFRVQLTAQTDTVPI